MTKKKSKKSDQKKYWNGQHKMRKKEHETIEGEPNEFAKKCLPIIKPGGKILEIGIASGRDARFFIRENKNTVVGVDISTEAIRQLIKAAVKNGTVDNILPVIGSAQDVPKLLDDQERYDAFYARSALHLNDDEIIPFLGYVVSHLNEDGVVLVQGKPKEDFKIARSVEAGKNCYEDVWPYKAGVVRRRHYCIMPLSATGNN
jgi:cyclopropane fatty-acyl-phospholipid synthase-like methyltransferase